MCNWIQIKYETDKTWWSRFKNHTLYAIDEEKKIENLVSGSEKATQTNTNLCYMYTYTCIHVCMWD